MGWGERRPVPVETAADRLADAVDRWIANPTTSHGEALSAALAVYQRSREAVRRRGEISVHIDEPPRVVVVPVPTDRSRR